MRGWLQSHVKTFWPHGGPYQSQDDSIEIFEKTEKLELSAISVAGWTFLIFISPKESVSIADGSSWFFYYFSMLCRHVLLFRHWCVVYHVRYLEGIITFLKLIKNVEKKARECNTYLTHVCRHHIVERVWWKDEIFGAFSHSVGLYLLFSPGSLGSSDVYRHGSGRCRILLFF